MLAYYLEWHMHRRLRPMLYDDTDKQAAEALRPSVVAKAERSPGALAKQTTGRTTDGLPVHSFHTLIADLATLTQNSVEIVTWQLMVRMRSFRLGLAVNCENGVARILNLTAIAPA